MQEGVTNEATVTTDTSELLQESTDVINSSAAELPLEFGGLDAGLEATPFEDDEASRLSVGKDGICGHFLDPNTRTLLEA